MDVSKCLHVQNRLSKLIMAADNGHAGICTALLEWGADASYVYHPPRRGLWGQSVRH